MGIFPEERSADRSGPVNIDTKCIFVSDVRDTTGHQGIHLWNLVSPGGGLSSLDQAAALEPRSPSHSPPKGPASSFTGAIKTVPNRSPRPFEGRLGRPSSSMATLGIWSQWRPSVAAPWRH